MNEIKIFENKELDLQVRIKVNEDGSVSMNAEDTAIGFGWTTVAKSGNEVVRWARMNEYCNDLGFSPQVGKGDYIPESLYYLLGMKAGNERALKYQKWLAIDVLPSLRKTGKYEMPKKGPSQDERAQAMKMNAKSRMAGVYLKLANAETISPEYKAVLVSKAAETLAGEQIIPLPKLERKTYSATEIGKELGITSHKVGRLTEAHKLKTEEYGMWVHDKAKYADKQVPSFRYYDNIIPVLSDILEQH